VAFFSHWEWRHVSKEPLPPRDVSIAFWEAFEWDDEAQRLAEEFAKGNPLLVAQQIKNCIRERDWRYLLNKTLYESPEQIQVSALVSVLARLCADSRAVSAVVNFNFDSIFEDHLADLSVSHSVVWSAAVTANHDRLSVLHPHGFLKRGGGPLTPLVLGEADYFESSRTPYAWPDAVLSVFLILSKVRLNCASKFPSSAEARKLKTRGAASTPFSSAGPTPERNNRVPPFTFTACE
jgi:hypothetical protein